MKITRVFLILIVFLLMVDFVAGLIYSRVEDKEDRLVELWKKSVTLNSLGFRDLEHDSKRKKDVFRLVVLGDSQTYGQLIQNDENNLAVYRSRHTDSVADFVKNREAIVEDSSSLHVALLRSTLRQVSAS